MSIAWLVFRREGCLWALPGAAVRRIGGAGAELRLCLASHELAADELGGTPTSLQVAGTGTIFQDLAPAGCRGLAVWQQEPLVVIDPECPPRLLWADRDEALAEEERKHDI